ncbi:MAG TPA: DNA polymerase III subunit gamma/tau [Chloroflexota bacterium]|nr:DNA polymerase III subunit gamma/tau [Chloroflexota bacterium]
MDTELSLFPPDSPSESPAAPEVGERASLYRAYRSRTFSEIAGQQHVTQTLRNAVMHGKVAHAYLFTGPRGTGKTSTARILARAVNCLAPADGEPCNQCAICVNMIERRSIDLIEIDGASNNSVDDVRELRDRVQFRPAEARRKVFIIDEVHMLSIGAFNALLKTLEEPPDHVLFLLATTEIHKVPATVLSRCQRLDLRPVPPNEMVARLRFICEREGMEAEDAVLELLSALGTGSLRDALSLMEQVRAYCGDQLRLAEVETALGVARISEIASLADLMAAGDLPEALVLLGTLLDSGIDPRQLTRQLSTYWRDAMLARARRRPVPELNVARCTADRIVGVLRSLLGVESTARRSDSPRFALELAVAEATMQLAASGTVPGEAGPARRQAAAAGPDASGTASRTAGSAAPAPPPTSRNSEPAPPSYADDLTADREAPRAEPRSVPAGAPPAAARESEYQPAPPNGAHGERVHEPNGQESGLPPPVVPPEEKRSRADSANLALSPERQPEAPSPSTASSSVPGTVGPDNRWTELLRWLQEHGTASVHQLAQKSVRSALIAEQEVVTLSFKPADSFSLRILEQVRNRQVLEQAVREVYGGRWTVRCVTISNAPTAQVGDDREEQYLEEIATAFGGEQFGPRGA